MSAYSIEMTLECGVTMFVVLSTGIVFVSHERGLGIDDEMTVFGEVQHNIRLEAFAIASGVTFLDIKLFALPQTGGFEHSFQNEFAPVSLGFIRTLECASEVVGFLAHGTVEFHKLADLFGQRTAVFAFLNIDLFDLALKLL